MPTKKRLNNWLNFGVVGTFTALVLVIILLYSWGADTQKKYYEQVDLYSVLNDTLKVYKGKDGENRARISQFQTEKVADFLKLQSSNKKVEFLQKMVKRYEKELANGGSVTTIETQGNYETTVPTEVVHTQDPGSPIYKGDSKNVFGEWARIQSIATKDSTQYTLTTNDKIVAVIGREPTGFLGLGKGKPFIDVTNLNPYSTTKDVRSYQVTEDYKRWSIGLGGTYGVVYTKGTLGFGLALGVTINYNLIKF